jgi:hypothetical protein
MVPSRTQWPLSFSGCQLHRDKRVFWLPSVSHCKQVVSIGFDILSCR